MQGSGATTSPWMDTATTAATATTTTAASHTASSHTAATLPAGPRPDVVVVGAGIAGVTTAYILQRSGKGVLLLDDGRPGGGETERTTAHLSNLIDDGFAALERIHGAAGARLAAESHGAAIDAIERIAREEGIACDFARVDGYLMLAPGGAPAELEEELAAAGRAGLAGLARVEHPPAPLAHPGPCLRVSGQARLHPLKYLDGLVAAFQRRGGRLATGVHVADLDEAADGVTVRLAEGGTLDTDAVVVATNTPVTDRFTLHTKQAAYRTYAIAARVPRGAVADALYWDTLDAYHYVRLQPGEGGGDDLLIVGGEDHKTGEAQDMDARWAALEAWMRVHIPPAGPVERRWSGQVMEPFDGLAFIGRDPAWRGRVYVVSGDSGMGMTHGTLAGLLLCELIHGSDHPWAALYDPGRTMAGSLGTFLKENLDVGRQVLRHLAPGDAPDEAAIAPGSGAVVRRGGVPLAVHRDAAGTLHRLSAVCPHLKCIVRWNPGESTWDCPCHGSRFAPDGAVLNGPANTPLAPADETG